MSGLIIKDFLLIKKSLLFALFYGTIMLIGFPQAGFIGGVIAVSYLLLSNTMAWDDKNKCEIMLNSLPVKRQTIVAAKYATALLFTLLAFLEFSILTFIIKAANLPVNTAAINAETTVGTFFAAVLLISLYLPFNFRFGYMKARLLNIVILIGAFAIPSLLLAYLPTVHLPFADFLLSLSEGAIIAGIIGTGLLLLVFSVFISTKFYADREF